MDNRPVGRKKHVTGQGKDVYVSGAGLGTGPVGNSEGYSGRKPGNPALSGTGTSSGQTRALGGKSPLLLIIIAVIVIMLFGGKGVLGNLFSGSGVDPFVNMASGNVSSGWTEDSNVGRINTSVDSSARAKRTTILGNGQDTVTIMVYMCGADLESKGGMATSDLQEMTKATIGNKVNLIVCTGGASGWRNNVVSNKANQIYKIENGKLKKLENNFSNVSMTTPSNLTAFIKYCAKNFPANRNELIMWDHGGGSITGYGYDERFAKTGSMDLKVIDGALKNAGVAFDFVGFDACLMATVENALMLTPYADYLIASEETEPGVGWYYTDWLTKLSSNTSMPTVEIGKNIADDFVNDCNSKCAGQKTTLSVIDLAELEKTVPDSLNGFASSTLDLLKNDEYKTVSDARGSAREFGSSNKVDQVDLVSLSYKLGTDESKQLANIIRGAVKYNRTSSNMTDAYGLSIYFPYRRMSTVNTAVSTYESIGMDDEYTACIRRFASMEVGGQAASGGASSPLATLFGSGNAAPSGTGAITDILSSLLSGSTGNVDGLSGLNSLFLGKGLDVQNDAAYISNNSFDASALVWKQKADGTKVMSLTEKQWALVQELEVNVFVDDGNGYIDLGLDNTFDFTDKGDLIGTPGNTWLAVDGQPVAYYYTDTVTDGDDYVITGRIPALLNGTRVNLIVVFDSKKSEDGYIAGAETVYVDGETSVAAKNMTELKAGDVIDFVCDYYTYDGQYQDSYRLGDRYTVGSAPVVSDVTIDNYKVSTAYRFTDIYRQTYWTPTVE